MDICDIARAIDLAPTQNEHKSKHPESFFRWQFAMHQSR